MPESFEPSFHLLTLGADGGLRHAPRMTRCRKMLERMYRGSLTPPVRELEQFGYEFFAKVPESEAGEAVAGKAEGRAAKAGVTASMPGRTRRARRKKWFYVKTS